MFEFVRRNTRWLMGGILVLLVIAFAAPTGYTSFMEASAGSVASVDGQKITQVEWDAEHRRYADRMRNQNPQIDNKLLDSDEVKMQSLKGLVDQRALQAAAQRQGLEVDDARVKAAFERDPQLSAAYRVDGKLNTALLAAQGLTEQGFVQLLRKDIQLRQVLAPVTTPAAGEGASSRLGELTLNTLLQQRQVRWQAFRPQDFAAQVQVSDSDVETYYKQAETQRRWQRAESADIEYLVLDLAALKAQIQPSEDDLRKAYESNKSRFTAAQERRFAHLLLRPEAKGGAQAEQQAKEKLQAWRAEVMKNPKRMAELARQYSEDEASKPQGGDLGFTTPGAFDPAFEAAALKLRDGEVSDVVKTEFGLHIIQALETRGGSVRGFDEVRAELLDELRTTGARQRFQSLSEQFTNTVFEQPASLKPAADKLGLSIQTATVARQPRPGLVGPLASAKLLEAVFSADAVSSRNNTEAIETAPNQLVSARVLQHRPAAAPPLEEVRAMVQAQLVLERATSLAKAAGEKRAKEEGDAGLGESHWISRAQPERLPKDVLEAALRADARKLPVTVGQDAGADGYWVVQVQALDKPKEGIMSPQDATRLLAQSWLQAESEAYMEALKRDVKAVVQVKSPPSSGSKP